MIWRSMFFLVFSICTKDPGRMAYDRQRYALNHTMVWDDVVVVRELFVADGAFPTLFFDNLAVQELSHLSRGSEFSISSRVMRILNTLHAHPYYCCLAFLSDRFPATAE